jgi:hypothetical protein
MVCGQSLLEWSAVEGDSPVHACKLECTTSVLRVELFGIAALSGW